MAGGVVIGGGPIKHYNGRPTVYLWFCVLLGGCGGLLLGYDNGVIVSPLVVDALSWSNPSLLVSPAS